MAKVSVVFTRTKSTGTVSRVRLLRGDEAIALNFRGDKATQSLDSAKSYGVVWELTGKHNDELKISWATQGLSGSLVREKIDRDRHRLLPGGKYLAEGLSSYTPEGE